MKWITGAWFMLCLATAVILRLSWRAQLPDPVAIHFGFDGRADGVASLTTELIIAVAVILLIAGLLWAVLVPPAKRYVGTTKVVAALVVGLVTFLTVLPLIILADQLGLANGATATLSLPGMGIALAAGIGAGLLAYVVLPAPEPIPVPVADTPVQPVPAGQQVHWESSEHNPAFVIIGLVLLAASPVAFAAGVSPWIWVLAIVGLAIILFGSAVTVTIDNDGIAWRLGPGPFRGRIPLDRLVSAAVVDVEPMSYGGWGYRLSSHGKGIILRRGEGITFSATSGMPLTITVPDAHAGAALTNGLIASR